MHTQYITAVCDVPGFTYVISLCKFLIGNEKLPLTCQGISLNCQLANNFFWMAIVGVVVSKKEKRIVKHSALHHDFCLQQFKFGSPIRIGNTELPKSLFGFLLAFRQVAQTIDMHSIVVESTSSVGI